MNRTDIIVIFYDIIWNDKKYYNNSVKVYGKYEVYGNEYYVDIE